MPRYKVTKPGYYNDILYQPNGKRSSLTVDKPFKKTPSWLTPMKEESAAQRAKREKAEKKAEAVALMRKQEDDKDIAAAVTFDSPMPQVESAKVETL